MIKLAITGCQGRIGQRLVIFAIGDKDFDLHALLERPDHPNAAETMNGIPISTSHQSLIGTDVLIDFTTPVNTIQNIRFCKEHHIKLVIGTTGFTPSQINDIHSASQIIPIVFSSNMSIGVNILFKTVELLAKETPASYTVKITEAHHIHKKDAPSGTAKTLADIIQTSSTKTVENIESIREGEIVGDHDIIFESPDDILTIRHHAKNRDMFVKGALAAAKFLSTKSSSLFTMADVLNLNRAS